MLTRKDVMYCGHFRVLRAYSHPDAPRVGVRLTDTVVGGVHLFVIANRLLVETMSTASVIAMLVEVLKDNGVPQEADASKRYAIGYD